MGAKKETGCPSFSVRFVCREEEEFVYQKDQIKKEDACVFFGLCDFPPDGLSPTDWTA